MHKRVLASLVVLAALAACAEAATAPEAASLSAESPALALASVPAGRMADLSIALADARARLLPAADEGNVELNAALQRLDERLAAQDDEGVMDAAAQVEAALAAIPAAEAEAVLAELDAVRLTLGEVQRTVAEARAAAAEVQ